MSIYHNQYVPYFYIIQDIRNGIYYAGSKWGKNSNPYNFMTEEGYKTSSVIIKELIKRHGLSNFIVRKIKTFKTGKKAYDYETKFLQKVNAKTNPKFYNGHNNNGGYKGLTYIVTKDQTIIGISPEEFKTHRNEYKHINESFIIAKDNEGNCLRVSKNDARWRSGALSGIQKGVKCHSNTRKAASKRWKGVAKSQAHNKKNSEAIKLLKWYCNFDTNEIRRFKENEQPPGYIRVSGPHKRLTQEQITEKKKAHKEDVIKRRTSGEQTESRSKAQLKRYIDNPLLGVTKKDLDFIKKVLSIYKFKPEVPNKNSVGRILSYDRSFANTYSKKLGVSRYKVFSIVSGKKNRILNVISKEKEFHSVCMEILTKN